MTKTLLRCAWCGRVYGCWQAAKGRRYCAECEERATCARTSQGNESHGICQVCCDKQTGRQ